jgi:hypothetical protein
VVCGVVLEVPVMLVVSVLLVSVVVWSVVLDVTVVVAVA